MEGRDQSQSDAEFARDLNEFRELLRTRDHEGLVSALENPEFYRLACDDDRYLGIAMQGIAVLAWDSPVEASEQLVHFDVHKSREQPDSDARQAARALLAALEWRHLAAQTVLPMEQMDQLREFLQLHSALAGDSECGSALRADIRAHSSRYVEFLEGLAQYGRGLPEWISQLALPRNTSTQRDQESPDAPVEQLSDEQRSAMAIAITELRETLARGPGRYFVGAAVLGTLVLFPNAMGILAALLTMAGFFALGERTSYTQIVRPRLVTLAIDHGVGAKAVVAWIYRLRRQAGRVSQFDIKIENDRALDLLAAIARSSRSEG